ncbi:MAG: hypothetical protein ACOYON_12585 [Fimbriimonas sp.]
MRTLLVQSPFGTRTFLSLLALLSLVAPALGQGSASAAGAGGGFGGGGFGGQGGGTGGAGGGRASADSNEQLSQNRPESDNGQGLWTFKKAILTPGDRVEFKFKLEKGEVLLASVASDSFDPALSVELGGKVLQKNDDRSEGDQSPFLNFRAPEKGEYLLKILSYRSVAGGQFMARFRVITPLDFELSSGKAQASPGEADRRPQRLVARLRLTKDNAYDLRGIGPNSNAIYQSQVIRIIGPTGVESQDFERIPTNGPNLIQAKSDGDYLIEYNWGSPEQVVGDFRLAPRIPIAKAGVVEVPLIANGRAIVEWPVKKGDIIQTTVIGPGSDFSVSVGPTLENDGESAVMPGWCAFRTNVDSRADIVRSFTQDGTVRLVVSSNQVQKVKVTNSDKIPEWEPGVPIERQLNIGDAPIFLFTSTKSELVRVAAVSTTFLPQLEILRLDGQPANTLFNRLSKRVGDDLYFPNADRFLIRFSCGGNGGSGQYTLTRETLGAASYKLGEPAQAVLGGQALALFEVKLEQGKRYELVVTDPFGSVQVDLLDAEGTFLPQQTVAFSRVGLRYFQPVRSGVHRLWFRRPGSATYKFILREYVEPSVDGG